MSELLVTRFFCGILFLEICKMLTFAFSKLKKAFRLSVYEDSEDILRCMYIKFAELFNAIVVTA